MVIFKFLDDVLMGRDNLKSNKLIHNILNKKRDSLLILLAFLILVFILVLPLPAGMSPEGQRTLGIFALALILWITNALPYR